MESAELPLAAYQTLAVLMELLHNEKCPNALFMTSFQLQQEAKDVARPGLDNFQQGPVHCFVRSIGTN